MKKLAPRRTAAPDLHHIATLAYRGIDLGQQGRQNVAGQQVEIIVWAIQVCRHHRHEIAAMLSAIGLAKLEPGDLSDGVPLVGWFEWTCQQAAFRYRLRGQTRIDAG